MAQYGTTTAHELGSTLYEAAAKFMLADATAAKGRQLGFAEAMQFYIAGRHGVLGDVTPEALAAIHGFIPEMTVKILWPAAGGVCSRDTAARTFAEACAEYGEDKLAVLPEAEAARLAELAERVVDAAPATPLFTAWRVMPRPDTPRARAAHLLHLLREWRGGVHVSAVAAAGLTPLEAMLSSGAESYAKLYGWRKPWPEKDSRAAEMTQVAATVDATCGRTVTEQLSPEEADELLDLSRKACALLLD